MSDAPEYDVLTMGRSCIDLYAHEIGVPLTRVKSFDAYVGGCPTNISVGTRRLGLRSALLTAVGEDEVADFVLAFLRQEGVETRFIPRKAGRRTSAVIMSIQPPDTFPLTFYRDNCADRALDLDDVRAAPVDRSRVLLVTGTGLGYEPSRSATIFATERARATGARVVVDIDYRPGEWASVEHFGVHMRALLPSAHLAVGTDEELRAASGEAESASGAERLLRLGLDALVLKRGAEGAVIFRRDHAPVVVPAFRIEVLNVLGAGDAFASGLLYGSLQGWPLERAVRMACATGAIVVTRHGCANFMPTLAEVEDFVASHGGW
ncbi:MAG TPA: 5-dehydro-2-deoxygluconokinase [Vicinamibacterales bacterium]|nr:5-dehydro-2-deoxygluconokinase [Vicinamibacterales bacterium]